MRLLDDAFALCLGQTLRTVVRSPGIITVLGEALQDDSADDAVDCAADVGAAQVWRG
eukprot:CAMPEP_0196130234 /NCGR_PEP_ID=MMETSP0910-20130528/681_1 /TAXON_ID=49265 /ORGANISM="Thalassiosira rotula, Strain GSO102" /LENGTH=56 /DNA_ID=CAMNT_0041389501 /DNA_START=407 /DNA_END=577 /DNA_ORIENTATION=+